MPHFHGERIPNRGTIPNPCVLQCFKVPSFLPQPDYVEVVIAKSSLGLDVCLHIAPGVVVGEDGNVEDLVSGD